MKKLIYLCLAMVVFASCGDDEDKKHGLEIESIPVSKDILEMKDGLWIKGMYAQHDYNSQQIEFKDGTIIYVDHEEKRVRTFVNYSVHGDTLTFYAELPGGTKFDYHQRIDLYKVKANHENNNIVSYMLSLGSVDQYTTVPIKGGPYFTTW